MPKIRIGVVGKLNAKGKIHTPKAPKPKPAKFKGGRVAPVSGSYHGKHTEASMRKRVADPSKPIGPNPHPKPKNPGYTKAYHAGKMDRATYRKKMDTVGTTPADKKYDAGLRNDPAHHKNLAAVHNQDRRDRAQEARDDFKESGWSTSKSKTTTNPKPKASPVTSSPSKPRQEPARAPMGKRPTNAADLISHIRKETGASSTPRRRNRYK